MSYRDQFASGQVKTREVIAAMTWPERTIWLIALINFVVFCVVATIIGGDAINGTSRQGHYFLMAHGIYREVSRPVFLYSEIHTVSTFLLLLLGLAAGLRSRRRLTKPQ